MVNQIKRYVYFVKPIGLDGPIKIGSSRTPATRLLSLGPRTAFPLEFIAVSPGDVSVEQALHARFADDLWHHEWFHASPRLLAFTAILRRNEGLEAALDADDAWLATQRQAA